MFSVSCAQNTPFSNLTYTLLGDDTGPTFFAINRNNGRITVRRDLKPDAATEYTVSMLCRSRFTASSCDALTHCEAT